MKMRLIILIPILLTLSIVNAGPDHHHPSQHQQRQKPNIVFILNDDQDLLMGSLEYMPKLQKLIISEGTTLSNYFISTPLCAPSRASILRGQYAHNTQIIDLSLPGGGAAKFHNLGLDKSTIGVWLRDAGYSTAFYGKYINSYNCNSAYAAAAPPGWDDWFALCDPHVYDYYNSSYSANGKIVSFPGKYQTETLGDKTVDFIQKTNQQGKPFFIHLSGVAPHNPATPAHKYANLFPTAQVPRKPSFNQANVSDMPGYIRTLPLLTQQDIAHEDQMYRQRLQCLQSVDDNVELIVTALYQLGILDNTYIFYTADNGFHLGYHRLFEGKRQAYEEDTRVPFIVRGPNVPKNSSVSIMVQNIDIAPTLAELAGVQSIPDFVDGKSFASYLDDSQGLKDEQDTTFRRHALLEHWGVSSEMPAGVQPYPNNTWQAIRVINSTFNAVYTSWCVGDHEYYNITLHPYEQMNGFQANTDVALELDGILRGYFQCKGDTCRNMTDSIHGDFKPLTKCYVNA